MQTFERSILIPDFWQQEAIRALQNGRDVIVSAPTGAGKTYIFELLIENGFRGKAIYTVPTRALANDKLKEWSEKGWNVGLITGDRVINPEAPVIVATLETQKYRLLHGHGPDLLVIDEYQMLGDDNRGVSYELAIATAPERTQLLLLSGSVLNPGDLKTWLQRLGRPAVCVTHQERPVPLEEIHLDALPDQIPSTVRGTWPRAIARALKAGMAPIIAFAPKRKAAEELAMDLSRMLPEEDPIILTPKQERLAGPTLRRLLRSRIAYHHSGLDYAQRAGLVEPLAKAGQLRVVVATMGLAAGINFSMRSVVITDREYRHGDRAVLVRPDELLQMFGRAGRRGMDKTGYILIAPNKPRLSEARPLKLQRTNPLEWPSLLTVMAKACDDGLDPIAEARSLAARLFSPQQIPIGLTRFKAEGAPRTVKTARVITQQIEEFQNPDGEWERRGSLLRCTLAEAYVFRDDAWKPALEMQDTLKSVEIGNPCRISKQAPQVQFGREIPLARFGQAEEEGELVLTKWTWQSYRKHLRRHASGKLAKIKRHGWSLDYLEKEILPHLPYWTQGGKLEELKTTQAQLYVRLHYREAKIFALIDSKGRGLINPPLRRIEHTAVLPEADTDSLSPQGEQSTAEVWYQLGLINNEGKPTRRGRLVSFFNQGEGLAIAAALEDSSYPVEEILLHLANLRAGHRFSDHESHSGRLGASCRTATHNLTIPGYFNKGLPLAYGDGAAEILFDQKNRYGTQDKEYGSGDLERVRLEWRSLVRQVSLAPDLDWDRWADLKIEATRQYETFPLLADINSFPVLTPHQRQRHKSFLTF